MVEVMRFERIPLALYAFSPPGCTGGDVIALLIDSAEAEDNNSPPLFVTEPN